MTACSGANDGPAEPVREILTFPAAEVCGYPSVSPTKFFVRLGKGVWSPVNDGSGSAYSCITDTQTVQLHAGSNETIEVTYKAEGVDKGARTIVLSYVASGPRPIANETTYRNTFINLANDISIQALKAPLPGLLTRKLRNTDSYAIAEKAFEEPFDTGEGFISIFRTRTANGDSTNIDLKIYSDKELKLKN